MNTPKDSIYVYIRTPQSIAFEGVVESISSTNEKGPFDILPEHENFISVVREKVVLTEKGGGIKEFPVDAGFIKVLSDEVHIFIGLSSYTPPPQNEPTPNT